MTVDRWRTVEGGHSKIMAFKGTNDESKRLDWIQLTTGKEFSRLLYPNPVCFLSTCDQGYAFNDITSSFELSSSEVEFNESNCGPGIDNEPKHETVGKKNVMVLSWITPTNNCGKFMFSINRNRFSTSLLAPLVAQSTSVLNRWNERRENFRTGIEFALSVPVKGMEELVLNVGSVSGRFGSKFHASHSCDCEETIQMDHMEFSQLSNRQRKKRKKEKFSQHGIPGLIPVKSFCLSSTSNSPLKQSSAFFVIQGTVAHLHCRTYAVVGTPPLDAQSNGKTDHCAMQQLAIDQDHLLIMAEVLEAAVHPMYWEEKKLLFRPQSKSSCSAMETEEDEVPPYLTFFGSQTFGYVTSSTLK
ncbi:hypothetical protein ACHAW6_002362 [Cyclotella cf. meneghiniana]